MATFTTTKNYRVEVFRTNPSELRDAYEGGNLLSSDSLPRRSVHEYARSFWLAGYWIEIYDEEDELKAGPIDPEAPFPALFL